MGAKTKRMISLKTHLAAKKLTGRILGFLASSAPRRKAKAFFFLPKPDRKRSTLIFILPSTQSYRLLPFGKTLTSQGGIQIEGQTLNWTSLSVSWLAECLGKCALNHGPHLYIRATVDSDRQQSINHWHVLFSRLLCTWQPPSSPYPLDVNWSKIQGSTVVTEHGCPVMRVIWVEERTTMPKHWPTRHGTLSLLPGASTCSRPDTKLPPRELRTPAASSSSSLASRLLGRPLVHNGCSPWCR